MDEGRQDISKTEARAGTTPHMTRYILLWGTGLTVLLFAIIIVVVASR